MKNTWSDLFIAAKEVQYKKSLSGYMSAGSVAAAVETSLGEVFVGVCMDTACSLGVCAERDAIFNAITNGQTEVSKVLALKSDGSIVPPSGACREFMVQVMLDSYNNIEVLLDYRRKQIALLGDLTPNWWV